MIKKYFFTKHIFNKIIILFLVMLQTVSSSTLNLTDEEKNWITNNPKVKVALAINHQPFSYKDNQGKPLGLDFDLLDMIESKTALQFDKIQNSWGESVHNFKTKQVDMIMTFGYKKEREAFTLFTKPYKKSNLVLKIYAKDGLTIDTNKSWQENFRDKKVGILKGIFFKGDLVEKKFNQLYEFNSKLELLKALSTNKIDLIIINKNLHSSIQKQFINIQKYNEIELTNIRKNNSHIGIVKENKILHSIITKALDDISKDRLKELEKKWQDILTKKNNIKLTKEEKAFLESNPTIKVAHFNTYAPLSYLDKTGNPIGYTVDYLKLIKQYSGLNITLEKGSWSELFDKVKKKKIDILPMTNKTKDREAFMLFSHTYLDNNPLGLFALKNGKEIHTVSDLKGKKLAIIKGWLQEKYLKENHPEIKLVPVKDNTEGMETLIDNKADYFMARVMVGNHYIKSNLIFEIKQAGIIYNIPILKGPPFHFAIRKDYPELLSIFNKSMSTIPQKKLNELYSKWSGISIKENLNQLKLSQEELSYLKKKNHINICVSPSWIPFEQITQENKHTGISADILGIISKKINKDFKLIYTKDWKQSIQNIKNRECDILPLAMKTPNHLSSMDFTKPYLNEPFVVATKLNEIYIRDEEQLSNKKIAIVEDSPFLELIRLKNPTIKIIPVKNTQKGLEKVRSNEVFAFIGTIPTIGYTIQKHGFVDLKIAGKLEETIKLSIASRNDEPLLNPIMQKALNSISKEEIRKIVGKWIEIKVQQEFDYKTLSYIAIIFIIIVIVILYENRIIRKKVKEAVEKNQEQERLIFFQSKLATMGETINIIAHQWRQPISLISNHLNSIQLKMEYKKDYTEKEILDSIKNAQDGLQYISSTITLFQSYLKPREVSLNETFEINETVERSLKLFEAILDKYKIKIKKEIPQYIKIKGNQEYFIQVLMVLLNNSKDAFIENDSINPIIKLKVIETEDKIIFTFEDNAKGIQIKENIFDPYISGKNSSGLGLFIAKNIISKIFSGEISHENINGGARFSIHFPI